MRSFYALVIWFVLINAGCNKDNETILPGRVTPSVSLSVSNLPSLPSGDGHYQVWASFTIFARENRSTSPQHDSGLVSLGEFNVGPDGHSILNPNGVGQATFSIPSGQNAQLLSEVIITVQVPETASPKPLHEEPGSPLIGARFVGTPSLAIADMNTSYIDALGTDFSLVTGRFTLTAPTSVPADSNSGVWFYEILPTPTASLHFLPSLGPYWRYEGWVLDKSDTTYYSTGSFARADSADYDGAGAGGGGGVAPNFPGQDFITGTPARPDLSTSRYAIRISIEPNPDTSPQPFFLTLLSSDTPGPRRIQVANSLTVDLQNVIAARLPTARLTVTR